MIYISTFFTEIYKIMFLLIPVLVSVALIVWLDRRVWAFVQKRRGPNVVGPLGLLQTIADALKYIFKEIIQSIVHIKRTCIKMMIYNIKHIKRNKIIQ